MTDEEKGKCFEDMFEDKEYIERIKNTCFNHKLFNTVAYINKLEKENAELRKALNNHPGTASATQLLELIQVREENERLEQEKSELLGIIQGKDKVIAEQKAQIGKMKCCENCKHHYWNYGDLDCRLKYSCYDTNYDKWELAE